MKDKMGLELKVGDYVCYCGGGQSDMNLRFGTIDSITGDAAYIKSETGRVQQKARYSGQILGLEPFKISHPELFL